MKAWRGIADLTWWPCSCSALSRFLSLWAALRTWSSCSELRKRDASEFLHPKGMLETLSE